MLAGANARAADLQLEDVVAATLSQSPALQQADAKVKQAAGQLKQAQGVFDWTASGRTGWQRLYVPKVLNGVLTNESETTSALEVQAGMAKKFGDGITIEPGFTFYANTPASQAQTFGLTTPRPHFNVNIPLWQGSGSDNPASAKAHAAQKTLEGSRFEGDFERGQAVHDAVQVYWRCLALRDQTRIAEAAEEDSLDYDALLKKQAQTGQLEPAELDRATADQAVRHVAVSKSQTMEQACGRELAQAMGVPSGTVPSVAGEFPDMTSMEEGVAQLNEQAMIDTALHQRLDLLALTQYAAAASEKVKGAHNGLGPQVDLSLDTDGVFVNLTKSLEGNLEDGQLEEAEAGETIARLNLRQLQDQVRRDVSDQVQALKAALADWKALSHSADLLEGVTASARKRAQAGFIPRSEQSDTETDLAQTRQQAVDAKLRFFAALAALRLSTGTVTVIPGTPVPSIAAIFRTLPGQMPASVGAAPEHG